MAFRNPPIAGVYLVRPAIQSPNYVLGSQGWTVNRDGTVEFNSGTFRGSLSSGNPSGQHVILNNAATSDAVDVYNASNQLVFSIDDTGRLVSASAASTATIVLNAASLFFEDTAQNPQIPPQISGILSPTSTDLHISGGIPNTVPGGFQPAALTLFSDGTSVTSPMIQATQRGITGAVMQTDSSGNSGQIFHQGVYTFTTNASGNATFNHNCGFTPKGGWLSCELGGGTGFSQYAWFTNPFTSTQASAAFWSNSGASVANATLTAYGFFVG